MRVARKSESSAMPPVNNQWGTAGWVKNRSMLLLFSGIHVVNSVISPILVYYSRQETTQKIGSMGSSSFFASSSSLSLMIFPDFLAKPMCAGMIRLYHTPLLLCCWILTLEIITEYRGLAAILSWWYQNKKNLCSSINVHFFSIPVMIHQQGNTMHRTRALSFVKGDSIHKRKVYGWLILPIII